MFFNFKCHTKMDSYLEQYNAIVGDTIIGKSQKIGKLKKIPKYQIMHIPDYYNLF